MTCTATQNATEQIKAFTLLELLVSLTILVSLVTLSSMMLVQSKGWMDDAKKQQSSLRPLYAFELLTSQWDARVRNAPDGTDENPSLRARQTELAFVTVMPMLFLEKGLVHVRYRIEQDKTAQITSLLKEGRQSLIYEEQFLSDPSSTRDSVQTPGVEPEVEQITLLNNASNLQWEQLVESYVPQKSVSSKPVPTQVVRQWMPVGTKQEDESRERAIRGYRLTGRHERRALEWAVIAEDLR